LSTTEMTYVDVEMRSNKIASHDSLFDIFDLPSYHGEFYDI